MTRLEFSLYAIQGLTTGATYALVAMSLSLVYRLSGMINFAAGDIVAVAALLGGYTLALQEGTPWPAAIAIALATSALIAVAVSYALLPPFRPRDTSGAAHGTWIIAAVATSILVSEFANLAWGPDQRPVRSLVPDGIVVFHDVIIRNSAILVIASTVLMALVLDALINHTRWGTKVRAASGDPMGSILVGINYRRLHTEVYCVAGLVAGAAGILIGPLNAPSPYMGFSLAINGFIAAALGGMGTIRGALVGGLTLGLIGSFTSYLIGAQWQEAVSLLVLVSVLIVTPSGIIPRRRARTV